MVKEYIQKRLETVREKHADKAEFVQTVEEFLPTLEPYLEEHPEIVEANILDLIIEPERIIQFRVPWVDDEGQTQVNLAYRVQYNSALGPYKGGMRFHPTVNESVVRFLGFEQTFKNGLTKLPIGGGKGGADFDPKGRSDGEIMRFCQSLMTELQKYIGPDVDVPAGDMGVGQREIGYMYGQYKRLNQMTPGVITGKPLVLWGSEGRTEATGYGLVYFTQEALAYRNQSLDGKRLAISGKGNVAIYAAQKAIEAGAKVVAMADSSGVVYDDAGLDFDTLFAIHESGDSLEVYCDQHSQATFKEGQSAFSTDLDYDIAMPCATQNEIDKNLAENMVTHGVKVIAEGANMPSQHEAVQVFKENGLLYLPSKAANAGGVAASALEMSQNSQRLTWTAEEVDEKLQVIMKDIYQLAQETANAYADEDDLQAGANIAGFKRVAEAMLYQGII